MAEVVAMEPRPSEAPPYEAYPDAVLYGTAVGVGMLEKNDRQRCEARVRPFR